MKVTLVFFSKELLKMDKKFILPKRVRRECDLHRVHEAAEKFRAGSQASDVEDIASVKTLAHRRMKEIAQLGEGDAHDIVTDGEFMVFVLLSTLPIYGIIGLLAALAGSAIGSINQALGFVVFLIIALGCSAFATVTVWNATEKYLPRLWARFIGARKLRTIEEDLQVITQH